MKTITKSSKVDYADQIKVIDTGKRFYSINDHEGLEEVIANDGTPDGYTKDVLIDLDGNKKNFRVGWYDTDDKEWRLYSDDTIDMKHAVYTKLDF